MSDAAANQEQIGSQQGPEGATIADWADLGREMWSYLTGRNAVVNYTFDDMLIEVPRDIGPDSPRATWRVHGTLRVTTSDDASGAAAPQHAD